MTGVRGFDVFLSHSSADKPAVELIAERLRSEESLRPFLDKWHLSPGMPWQDELVAAIVDCSSMAVFVGPSGTGPWHHEEVRVALDRAANAQDEFAWNWPAGLIRRALLEVGRRLNERGGAHDPEHAVELDHAEVAVALRGGGPDADTLADRRRFRDQIELSNPPAHLRPIEEPPPLHVFPKPLALMAGAVMALIDAMETAETDVDLSGTGVGEGLYRGRACVVRSPADAFDELRPGDVLVVPFTSPSYDSLFPLVGALVTDHGGVMSHTAIMAREFGVPAVVGTGNGTTLIPHGAEIEVDAKNSTVRLV